MTIAHYINEDRSYMRSIKSGWYALGRDGTLAAGPFSTYEECSKGAAINETVPPPESAA